MNEQTKKHCEECGCNSGVRCEVKSCTYHNSNGYCEAETIHVGPQFAVSSQDTVCATFKNKQ